MKKTISMLLVFVMLFSTFAIAAFAESGKSVTLPFVYTTDANGIEVIKYTVAIKCNGDHIPMPEDTDPYDTILPERPACTEHTTVIYAKYGEDAAAPDIDYTISYDMSVYENQPNKYGQISDIQQDVFVFSLEMAEKYAQTVTITTPDGKAIAPNPETGKYELPMTKSYMLQIPENGTLYPNFTLRRVNVTLPEISNNKGYNVYTFIGDETGRNDRGNIYERQNGFYGQDYYAKVLLHDGYRKCLKNLDPDTGLPIAVSLTVTDTSELLPLPSIGDDDTVSAVAKIYLQKKNGETFYYYDFADTEEDDVDATDSSFTMCGVLFKIDGAAMKTESVKLSVSGVLADRSDNVFTVLLEIFRFIINYFKNLKIFG